MTRYQEHIDWLALHSPFSLRMLTCNISFNATLEAKIVSFVICRDDDMSATK